jgi:FimV-like protein
MNFQDQAQQIVQSVVNNFNQAEPFLKTNQPLIMGASVFLALFLTLRLIKSRRKQIAANRATTYASPTLSHSDMAMLAGDDVISTQFDLARAYIEMGKSHLAKSILFHISKSGSAEQKQEAKKLIQTL